ncbi:iron transporter [Halorussus gelatinilyticus]|uniref:Iron transporter n=1 Tax=Halorussus gelatinilyticus TaxID=2937524 RepID=A0A8U0IEX7_9EURY|nr:iron transporter [Halorussus gelatinilyticus]UPV99619.1 iron transporter [Halorussus gelatinilyticus]
MPDNPAKQTSDEVDQTQLDLAQQAGDAYREALDYMAEEVAHTGGKQEAGDYVVGFAQEEAEGMYVLQDEGRFEWVEPDDENCHLEVAVCDAADGRFVPECTVIATLTSEDGEEVGPTRLPLLWHPGLYHYGKDLEVPGDGTYTIDVRVEPPEFKRHDEQNGDRYGETVAVTFEDVDVETGQD